MTRWLSRKALAEYLDCSVSSVRLMEKRREIPPPVTFLSMKRWDREAVDRAKTRRVNSHSSLDQALTEAIHAAQNGNGQTNARRRQR